MQRLWLFGWRSFTSSSDWWESLNWWFYPKHLPNVCLINVLTKRVLHERVRVSFNVQASWECVVVFFPSHEQCCAASQGLLCLQSCFHFQSQAKRVPTLHIFNRAVSSLLWQSMVANLKNRWFAPSIKYN